MSQIRHVGIEITNHNKAIKFYCEVLGFRLICKKREKDMLKDLDFTWYKLASDGECLLELYKCHNEDSPLINESVNHIALTVNNIKKIYEELKKRKMTILTPIIVDKSGKQILFCKDYDDNMLELVEESNEPQW